VLPLGSLLLLNLLLLLLISGCLLMLQEGSSGLIQLARHPS
jgi:hypothetical protein